MRILLAATASYAPPHGGATRSNLSWLNHLAGSGHECRVVSGPPREGPSSPVRQGIVIEAVPDPGARVLALRARIREFQPDWVLVSSEDLGHALLREAHHSAPGRVVYLAHTPQFFPFGSASWNPEKHAAALIKKCAGIVTVGPRMAAYVERELGVRATVIHPPIYGEGPYSNLARFGSGVVAMINPCAVKGISIFLGLAESLPSIAFGAVPGWGTTEQDRRSLSKLANIRILPNAESVEALLRQMCILLMPSLWLEGFGLIAMEAMLRGIPVVASDSGGLCDAKRGTNYLIPTHGITRYLPAFDEHGMPLAVTPDNDLARWVSSVRELLEDRAAYERESEASSNAARRFVASLDAGEFERFLSNLNAGECTPRAADAATIESLTPEKRALLLELLRARSQRSGDAK